MKKITQIFAVIFLFIAFKPPEAQAQSSGGGWLTDTTIIPVTAGLWWGFTNNTNYPGAMDSMRAVVDGIGLDLGLVDGQPGGPGADEQMDFLTSSGFRVIPVDVYKNSTFYNWVQYYSDARYTVWEVEGEYGDTSYLQHNPNIMEEDSDGDTTFIRLIPNGVCGQKELMWGPYYSQYVYGLTDADTLDYSRYTATFRMKLEDNPNPPVCPDTVVWTEDPETPICIIKVTQSSVAVGPWRITGTYTIDSLIIPLGQFKSYFDDYSIIRYNLLSDSSQSDVPGEPIPQANTGDMSISSNFVDALKQRHYVEFKVIWLGNPNYLLSIDKVTVSDEKGSELMNPTSDAVARLQNQLNQLTTYNSSILGWLGRDEPNSIDQYAPIKKVNEIINSHPTAPSRLWLPLMGKWGGAFGDPSNPIGIYRLSPWKEMKKRIGDMNVWQDAYYLDSPWNDTLCNNCTEPWYSENIKIAAELNYKRAYELNPNFGVSLQCGEVHLDNVAEERNITDYEFLYETNLALMYGAKFLSLYTYFAQRKTNECSSGLTCHAIVDILPSGTLEYTTKYTMLRYTIRPRLTGVFGKTLKKLTATDQYLRINAEQNYNFISTFSGNLDCLPTTADYDLGFFTDSLSRDYFMIISRYYNDEGVCPIFANLDENYFSHNNLLITKYASDTSYTIPNDASIKLNLVRGDAEFCRIVPVIHSGGDLIYDETISGTNTLTESELIIKDGARLTVSGTYNIERDIIVEQGGELVLSAGAQLVFYGNARLTVHGNLVSNGTPTNKVVFAWGSMLGSGITIKKNITLQHIRIIGADVAINIDLSNQGRTGTTVIRYNEFVNCITDIIASNTISVLIQNNNFSQCDMGIFLSNVSSFNIVSNYLESQTGVMPGIFVNSSSGNIRNNTITGFSNGIVCANSSPIVGGNNIFNNVFHGIYVGEGSQPDLRAALYQVPCSTPPLYYPVSGFNHIYENGGLTTYPLDDGSEIYLNNSNILLDEGSNCIIDNREERAPVYSSRLLINGNIDTPVLAAYNEWGWHPEFTLDERFDIDVTYAPTGSCALPDNMIDCELIIKTIDGIVIDTIYAVAEANEQEEEIKEMYAQAESKYLSQDYTAAKTIYNDIITDYAELRNSFTAYSRLLTIERIESENPSAYEQLRNFYLSNLNAISDTLLHKMVMQLANLTLISGGGFNEAIAEFQDIIDNNPGSEAADFAEIDIYTTALLNQDSILAKGKLVKVTGDNYISMVNSLIRKRFSSRIETGDQIIIPVEYLLYQNYPNPFNPTTTIKFDLPKDGVVELGIYDILGRKITTLINEYRNAGSYEQNFNASSLASGIYLYRIKVNDFVSAKKMILVK